MVDLDNILKYASPKYVYIRNAKLGIMKYLLMLMIFMYVIVYEIIYSCVHLEPHHASGFGSIFLESPSKKCGTSKECYAKLDPMAKLKYCTQAGAADAAADDDAVDDAAGDDVGRKLGSDKKAKVGDIITKPSKCRYLDGHRALWTPPQPSEIFVPTHYKQIRQEIQPDCYDPSIQGVKGAEGGRSKFKCTKPWVTKSTEHYYTANIEDFNLFLQHTFQQPALGLSGTSVDYQGFLAACKTNHPTDLMACKRMKIPNSVGDSAPEDLVGLTSAEKENIPSLNGTSLGDQIRFGALLKTTPVAQFHNLTGDILDMQLPDSFAHPGKSLREVGGMLLLDVNYDNFGLMRPGITIGGVPKSFEVKPVTYTYRPYFLPMKQNMKTQLLQDGNFPSKRIVNIWYGVTIRMQFNGVLVKYSNAKVITALTNGLVLLATATTLVMLVAAYLLPLKEKYNLLMYQMSEDFSAYNDLKSAVSGKPPVASMYANGDLLLTRLKDEAPLTNQDKLAILCTNEMRLNRLDGMDPDMTYLEGTEQEAKDPRRKIILESAQKYYEAMGVTSSKPQE